jgi:uncharacterized membrane protein
MNDEVSKLDRFIEFIITLAAGFTIGALSMLAYQQKSSTPVENNNVIDSLTQVNDSIKIKIEKLDSIKDAKVIEVNTLNNDSTLKLFYKLVSE